MESKEPISSGDNENKKLASSPIKEFLSELIKTILPRHTVVIILMVIIGYFLFYPSVQNNDIYKTLVGLDRHSPFLYVYFIFGIIYLTGGMFLTWKINEMQEETEKERIKSLHGGNEHNQRVLEGMELESELMERLLKLGIPKNNITREASHLMGCDAVIYDDKHHLIAVGEAAMLSKNNALGEKRIVEKLKRAMRGNPDLKGGYLLISYDKGEELRFYNMKGEKMDSIPTYEELLKHVSK